MLFCFPDAQKSSPKTVAIKPTMNMAYEREPINVATVDEVKRLPASLDETNQPLPKKPLTTTIEEAMDEDIVYSEFNFDNPVQDMESKMPPPTEIGKPVQSDGKPAEEPIKVQPKPKLNF